LTFESIELVVVALEVHLAALEQGLDDLDRFFQLADPRPAGSKVNPVFV
jgi:hypothetical protein